MSAVAKVVRATFLEIEELVFLVAAPLPAILILDHNE